MLWSRCGLDRVTLTPNPNPNQTNHNSCRRRSTSPVNPIPTYSPYPPVVPIPIPNPAPASYSKLEYTTVQAGGTSLWKVTCRLAHQAHHLHSSLVCADCRQRRSVLAGQSVESQEAPNNSHYQQLSFCHPLPLFEGFVWWPFGCSLCVVTIISYTKESIMAGETSIVIVPDISPDFPNNHPTIIPNNNHPQTQ